MTFADDLSLQIVRFSGKGMASLLASLLASSRSHSLPSIRGKKLTLGEKITVRVPHSIVTLMKYRDSIG
jgi:hypothetical protein